MYLFGSAASWLQHAVPGLLSSSGMGLVAHGMWGLSSPTRDKTCTPCIGRQFLSLSLFKIINLLI